jgi:hypothetical protein
VPLVAAEQAASLPQCKNAVCSSLNAAIQKKKHSRVYVWNSETCESKVSGMYLLTHEFRTFTQG